MEQVRRITPYCIPAHQTLQNNLHGPGTHEASQGFGGKRVQEVHNDFHKNSTLSITPSTLVLSQVYGGVFQMCDHDRSNAEADMRIQMSPTVT